MHPRTRELLDHLDTRRAELRAAVDQVPPGLRRQRPEPSRWSVAEILEHLVVVQRRMTQILAAQISAAREEGVGPESETSPVLDSFNMAPLLDRRTPRVASEASSPRGEMDADAAWEALEQSKIAFRDAVLSGDGLALSQRTLPHPALGPLNLYHWIAFAGAHEARHAAQIREIAGRFSAS
ncbi:MAG: DinB family protein [Acidobacteriota bacterium]